MDGSYCKIFGVEFRYPGIVFVICSLKMSQQYRFKSPIPYGQKQQAAGFSSVRLHPSTNKGAVREDNVPPLQRSMARSSQSDQPMMAQAMPLAAPDWSSTNYMVTQRVTKFPPTFTTNAELQLKLPPGKATPSPPSKMATPSPPSKMGHSG